MGNFKLLTPLLALEKMDGGIQTWPKSQKFQESAQDGTEIAQIKVDLR